jgi:hypothetical protein
MAMVIYLIDSLIQLEPRVPGLEPAYKVQYGLRSRHSTASYAPNRTENPRIMAVGICGAPIGTQFFVLVGERGTA